jgi:hypothetical protein
MEAFIQSLLPSVEWRAFALAGMRCSWDWLPKLVITSWERDEAMLGLDTFARLMSSRKLP